MTTTTGNTDRTSDAALCRRIYEARGWTDLHIHGGVAYGRDPEHPQYNSCTVPCPDVDPAACLELMTHLLKTRKVRYIHFNFLPAADTEYEECQIHANLAGWHHEYWRADAGWLEQAFARAAADALEAMQKGEASE